jgi:hypothetical protein
MGVGSVRTAVSESDEAKDNEVRRREFELVDGGGGGGGIFNTSWCEEQADVHLASE